MHPRFGIILSLVLAILIVALTLGACDVAPPARDQGDAGAPDAYDPTGIATSPDR